MACGGVPEDPQAVVGLFVCHEEIVYAVVCKHVTTTANSPFYVQGIQSPFAKTIRKKKKNETPTFTDFDIDLIKVEHKHIQNCRPVFRDARGNIRRGHVFVGDVNDLMEREVFPYKNNTSDNKPTAGIVLHSSKIDKTIAESYNMDTHFVVGGDSFSVAGDSGRIVVVEDDKSEDGLIELVGIIVHKAGDQTVCLKLHQGLEYLNQKYRLKLTLWEPERHDTSCEETLIEPGDIITFDGLKRVV